MRTLLVLAVAALLAACDNTTIAFCSGGDAFCGAFFGSAAGEDEDEEEDSEEETGAASDEALQAALKITRLTPGSIETALARGNMENLVAERPDFVGLWLVQASLGRLWDLNDNVATTQFLDQNRAWLSAQPSRNQPNPGAAQLLTSGLRLFADFAAELDPASAEAALARVDFIGAHGDDPVTALEDVAEAAATTVILAAGDGSEDATEPADGCCTTAELAAAALVLCGAHEPDAGELESSREQACGHSARWFEENVGQAREG